MTDGTLQTLVLVFKASLGEAMSTITDICINDKDLISHLYITLTLLRIMSNYYIIDENFTDIDIGIICLSI